MPCCGIGCTLAKPSFRGRHRRTSDVSQSETEIRHFAPPPPADRPGAKAAKREPSWVDGIAETHHSEGARGFTLKQKRAAAHAKPYRKKIGVGKVDVAIGAKRSAAKAHRTQKPRR